MLQTFDDQFALTQKAHLNYNSYTKKSNAGTSTGTDDPNSGERILVEELGAFSLDCLLVRGGSRSNLQRELDRFPSI